VTSETEAWASRSNPATAGSALLMLATSGAIKATPDLALKSLEITAATITRPRT
jgi:hypothetical protein